MSIYARYFGLHENPFALPPDPRYLYLAPRYQEALAHLTYGITQGGGFVQLTGEVGTGKTMMIRALLDRLPKEVNVALVLYPLLSVQEFVLAICDDLRIPRSSEGATLKSTIDTLNRFLLENHAHGRRTVLVIDEAHKLSHDVLEQVRLLTNLETSKEKLLQILLVGQPELTSLLAQRDLRQLAQRITARYKLTPLQSRETAEYVVRRLKVAGAENPIFTRAALSAVHRRCGGIPRLINTLCDRALLGAYAHGKNRVTAGVVRRAAAEVGHGVAPRYGRHAAIAAGVIGLLAFGGWQLSARLAYWPPSAQDTAVASPMPAEATASPKTTSPAPAPALSDALSQSRTAADTDAAFTALFAQWHKDYTRLAGDSGCARARNAGLQCIFATGTWNNLRLLNRPAVIELIGAGDAKYQLLVTALNGDRIELEIDGTRQEFSRAEVERFWFGKFLTLWKPPPSGELTLRIGMQGPAVVWLQRALARVDGEPGPSAADGGFDAALEAKVRAFQRRHGLEPDGIVGRNTLIQLDAYDADIAPVPLARSTTDTEIR
ncbi:MAG TPA: AAA family ATPase [Burkholderiales bacterium]